MIDIANRLQAKVQVILPPVRKLSYIPIKDAMLMQSQPFVNYGDVSSMQICPGNDGSYSAVFGFGGINIPADVWNNIVSVKLRFKTDGYNPSPNNVGLYELPNNSWTESGISWANAPATGALIQSKPILANATAIDYDITEYVQTTLGNFSGKNFSFCLKADSIPSYPLMIASKENTNTSSRPVIIISYYDATLTPMLNTIAGSVEVLSPVTLTINGDINVDSDQVTQYIEGELTVPRFPATIPDIDGVITVYKTFQSDIDGDLVIDKEDIATDINGSISVSIPIDPTPCITGTIVVDKKAIMTDIDGTIDVEVLTSNDITGNLVIDNEDTITNIDGSIDVSVAADPSDITGNLIIGLEDSITDIDGSIDVSVVLNPIDINGNLVIDNEDSITDIDGDLAVAAGIAVELTGDLVIDNEDSITDIDGDINILAHAAAEIAGFLKVELPMAPIDIDGVIEVLPGVVEDINGTINVEQTITVEITGDIIAMQKTTSFIDGTIDVALDITKELNGDIEVEVETHKDIDGNIVVQARGSSYVYIL